MDQLALGPRCALAAGLGVEVLIFERSDPAEIVECLKAGACDVALLGITASRAAELDFSPPYLQADLTYLVPAGSSVRRVTDADQPGVRIAVVRNHAMDFALRGKLKRAEPIYAETPDAAFDLLRTGQVTVQAGTPRAPNVFHPAARFAGAGGPLRGQCHRDGSAEGPGRVAQLCQRVHCRVQNLGLGAAGYGACRHARNTGGIPTKCRNRITGNSLTLRGWSPIRRPLAGLARDGLTSLLARADEGD